MGATHILLGHVTPRMVMGSNSLGRCAFCGKRSAGSVLAIGTGGEGMNPFG